MLCGEKLSIFSMSVVKFLCVPLRILRQKKIIHRKGAKTAEIKELLDRTVKKILIGRGDYFK